jgi:hypothetical protein
VPFVKFIPRYLILFETITNGIVFLCSFSIFSLVVYRKATDFCKLILYPDTLLKMFMVSRSFSVDFFGFLSYRIILSANRDSLTIYLPICIPFISSSCLIALVKNSRTVLNRSGESGHPVSFLTLEEMVSVFPH